MFMLSCDVETNLESSTDELLQLILEKQTQIETRLTVIKGKLESFSGQLVKVEKLETAIQGIKCEQQQKRLSELEDRARRNNLVVCGVPESTPETEQDLSNKVIKDICSGRLGLTFSSVERIHRIGQKKGGHPRPVIMRLYDYTEKVNCDKLKGTVISVSDDFSQKALQKRKLLWHSAKNDKRDGVKIKLVRDKLYIDDAVFKWDMQSKARVKIDKRANSTPSRTN